MLRYINRFPRVICFFLLFVILAWPAQCMAADLILLAGAGLRQPTDKLVEMFRKQTGHNVFVDYGGSGNLLARITASGQGDLYMPGAFYYIQKLEKNNMIHAYRRLVLHTPVIGVNLDSANLVRSFKDLARPGVRLALGDPKAMAFGRISMDILEKSDMKEEVLKNVVVYGATVKQLALYVAQGDVNASIIGRADAIQYKDKIIMVPIPPEYLRPEIIAIALLKRAANRSEAIRFLDFMASSKAIETFQDFGFLPLQDTGR